MRDTLKEIMKERPWDYLQATIVGSRATCCPYPMDTDLDILILTTIKSRFIRIANQGPNPYLFSKPNAEDDRASHVGSCFESMIRGDVNLIITDDNIFHAKFLAASSIAKRLNLRNKDDRIALFQAVLYGNPDQRNLANHTVLQSEATF